MNILLVEDHVATRSALTRILLHHGFNVIAAESAEDALRLFDHHFFDILVSDIGLPNQSGLELMTELRKRRPNFPGIALTAYGTPDDIRRTKAVGFTAHLIKPINFAQLERIILSLNIAGDDR